MWGALALAGASIAGQYMANEQNEQMANSANKLGYWMAREQMDFQHGMDSTKYQRAAIDLEKAGINPMLASGHLQGGGAPGASYAPQRAHVEDVLSKGVSSAVAAADVKATIENKETQNEVNEAVALTEATKAQANIASAKEMEERAWHTKQLSIGAAADNLKKSYDAGAWKPEAELRRDRAKLDKKLLKLDATLERTDKAAGVIGSALGLGMLKKALPRSGGETRQKWPNAEEMREQKRQDHFRQAEDLFRKD